MVWRLARPPGAEPYYSYGSWGNILPLDIVENALKITQSEHDKAHAHYLVAMTLRNQGGEWDQRARVPDEFEAAIKTGRKTDWHDDALYQYAEWMLHRGRAVPLEDGNWRQEPDFVKALALFQQLVTDYKKGETRYWEQAQNQIRSITAHQLSVSVANVFLPDSEIQYSLSWRNVKRIDLALYPGELNRDLKLKAQTHWHYCIDLSRSEAIASWSKDTQDKGDYKPGNETLRLEDKLKPGAYVLEAKAAGNTARDLVLVSDATVVLKTSGKQALVWFCNALNGEPLVGAKVKLSEHWHENNQTHVRETEKNTDADGVARFDLSQPANHNSLELFASAILKDRQAFSTGVSHLYRRNDGAWKVYALTDRPAYRPKETVQWKFIARRYNGSVYSTPSDPAAPGSYRPEIDVIKTPLNLAMLGDPEAQQFCEMLSLSEIFTPLTDGGCGPTGVVLAVDSIRVTFPSCVDIVATTGIEVDIGGAGWEAVASVSGGSDRIWEFETTTAIAEGDVVLWQYLGAEDSIVDCAESADVGVLDPVTVRNPLELTAPTLVSAEVGAVDDSTFVLVFSEDIASADFAVGWSIEADATELTITGKTGCWEAHFF